MAALPPVFTVDAPRDGLAMPRRSFAAIAIFAAIVLVVLDGAIANVALPALADALAVPPAATVWVVTGYQTALVMALLPSSALGEAIGMRRVFVAGVVLFVAASAGCALSSSLPWLVAFRFVQGLGGSAIMALGIALLRFIYPQRLLGAAIGWNALAIALSAAAGPSIGASILSAAGWPWLFAVNLPVGVVVLSAARALPAPHPSGRRLDFSGMALNAAGFAACVIGFDQVSTEPVSAALLVLAGAASLAVLVRRDWTHPAPLVPLDLLRMRPFRLAVIASVCCFSAQMAGMIALAFLLQHGLGQSALTAGVYLTPWPLAVAVAAPLSGRLSDRYGTAWLCATGGTLLAAGMALSGLWPMHGDPRLLVPFTMIAGFGFGLFQTPNNRTMLLSAPKARSGAAGGMQGTARLTGQTAGAVLMALLFSIMDSGTAPQVGLVAGAVLALVGGFVSLLRIESHKP